MPLIRRVPKRGFTNIFRQEFEIVNLSDLERFPEGSVVSERELAEARLVKGVRLVGRGEGAEPRLVRRRGFRVKVLANGALDRPLTVRAHAFSAAARRKIEAAGGTAEVCGVGATAPDQERDEGGQ